jgi:nucleotide-binding universal stress UspA family protein
MKILIALEESSPYGAVARAAGDRPWPSGSSFCLLNVANFPDLILRPSALFEKAEIGILKRLDHAAEELKQAGWNVRTEVVEGKPRHAINSFAKDWQADLVMIGAHEGGGSSRVCLGSTARSVVRHAPCSVEIVRPRMGRLDKTGFRILAATDGSEFSTAALQTVADRPWPHGTEIKLITVPELVPLKEFSHLKPEEIEGFADLGAASIEDAKRCLAAGLEILSRSGIPIYREVPRFEERPYRVILHEASQWDADLIVLGSHGRGGFDRMIMGSVAEAAAFHATCSIEIIRRS